MLYLSRAIKSEEEEEEEPGCDQYLLLAFIMAPSSNDIRSSVLKEQKVPQMFRSIQESILQLKNGRRGKPNKSVQEACTDVAVSRCTLDRYIGHQQLHQQQVQVES